MFYAKKPLILAEDAVFSKPVSGPGRATKISDANGKGNFRGKQYGG
jgi:hypothetical protein